MSRASCERSSAAADRSRTETGRSRASRRRQRGSTADRSVSMSDAPQQLVWGFRMAGRNRKRTWVAEDSALWHTCAIVAAVRNREWRDLPNIGVSFVTGEHERVLASSPFELYTWRALGDGSYAHSSGTMVAWGRGALPVMVGFAAGQAMGNSARRSAAVAATVPRWVHDDGGQIYVTTHGFHLQTMGGLYRWSWDSIDSAQVVHHSIVEIHGRAANGAVHWRFRTPAAELLFTLWALVRHPRHPQLISGTWLPPNWARWAAEQGYPIDARAITS